ncbi:MAG: alcohol dehydrogenase catalytic domain-containing protein [Proteobacteria bacterium]|nr:alcohol dehydrogenase catalytic domain-containing protein [Pseudomonadota bacterium]
MRFEGAGDYRYVIMQALMKYQNKKGAVQIREINDPVPLDGWVKIGVDSASICGSDIHIYDNTIKIRTRPPVVIGHEFSGVIVETGKNVKSFKVGDRVVSETTIKTCGFCSHCHSGKINMCPNREVLGYYYDGSFAKYLCVPESKLHIIPDNVDFDSAALVEPLACCVHGVIERTRIGLEDRVAISGPGCVGLLSLQLAISVGARVSILGTESDKTRLEMAEYLGADHIICVDRNDPLDSLNRITSGEGVDVFLDCSGAGDAIDLGLRALRPHGYYTQIGFLGRPVTVDYELIAYKELNVTGAISQLRSSWALSLELLERGKVKTLPLITERMSLKEWKSGFEKVRRKDGLKIILKP